MDFVQADNDYSRLLGWEVYNFMSLEHAKVEFDERNIINLKGYNDSGKSAMLMALDVLMSNYKPSKQVSFIQDDKDYFRIIAYFSDGVVIMRDKYINGQSLYEMYKDGQLLFTTKNGKALARVGEVPEPIERYLGLIHYDGVSLNSRSCFEKQIGVQTSGSENYKMFNTVLKSEEIASAGAMLNNDKNKLIADVNSLESEIAANKTLTTGGENLTIEMIEYLKEHDKDLDNLESIEKVLKNIEAVKLEANGIIIPVQLETVDVEQVDMLSRIESLVASLQSIQNYPELEQVDDSMFNLLLNIQGVLSQLSNTVVTPEVQGVQTSQLNLLDNIQTMLFEIKENDEEIEEIDRRLVALDEELKRCEEMMKQFGVKMVTCPSCGKLFSPEEDCC